MEKIIFFLIVIGGIYWFWQTHPILTILIGIAILFIIGISSKSNTKPPRRNNRKNHDYNDISNTIINIITSMMDHH